MCNAPVLRAVVFCYQDYYEMCSEGEVVSTEDSDIRNREFVDKKVGEKHGGGGS